MKPVEPQDAWRLSQSRSPWTRPVRVRLESLARAKTARGRWLWPLALLAIASSCKDTTCRGLLVDGECLPACRDAECPGDGRCIDNACAPRCEHDADCEQGRCRSLRTDRGATGKFCDAPLDGSSDAATGPNSPQCDESSDCAQASGQRCVDGLCRLTCERHAHCGGAGACADEATDSEGDAVLLCRFDDFPRNPGEYGTRCPSGAADCAEGFRCVGAGEGDADAYCTATGCDDDSQCPTGMFCSHNRTSAPPCESACGLRGEPTNPNCVPSELIGDGLTFRCGTTNERLELRICLARSYCSDCETDADCRSLPGQICADGGNGTKICTTPCDPETNSCPWGSASSCEVFDEALGVPTCGHRSGGCHGEGAGCEPCVDDRDCPRGFCSLNSFSGEQFCVDEAQACECPAGGTVCQGGGCPLAPSGLEMNCVPRQEGAAPDACYGARTVPDDPTSQLGCWPRETTP